MKFKLTINLLLLFIGVQAFGQNKSVYEKSVDLFNQNGQQEKIIPYLETELKRQPKNENLLRLLGFQYLQLKNIELGERYYREAIAVNPNCGRCYLNIARIYAQKNDFKQALVYCDKAVEADPKDDLLVTNRAQIKEINGDTFGALADHDKAISLAPKNSNNYTERGIYNLNQKYYALALTDFNKAIELEPSSYTAYFYRSRIKFESNDLNAALKDIDQAILLDDKQNRLYNFRGTIYNALKQPKNSLLDYSKAITLSTEDFYSYLSRAQIYYALENMDAACEDYAKAKTLILKQKVAKPELLDNIEESMLDVCDESKASYFYQRGVALYNLKQYDKALAIYNTGLQKFPTNPMILSFKGNAYLALRDYQNSMLSYAKALTNKLDLMAELKNNPRFKTASSQEMQSFYNGLVATIYYNSADGAIYFQKYGEALTAMNEAIELAPNIDNFNKETYYARRGNIYLDMNKYDLAHLDFNQSIQINKNYAPAYIGRAIANVSMVTNAKKSKAIISGKLPNQPFRVNWEIKSITASQKANPDLITALEDCNKAIALDDTNGFAHYVRGKIKSFLGYPDYRVDLMKAKAMGIVLDASE